jgi:anti-anti-sigma factor
VFTRDESAPCVPILTVSTSVDGSDHVLNVSGELDVRTRRLVEEACLTGHHPDVVVELSELTFMDCCGYAGLVAIRRALLAQGGSLTLTNQTGQPARLLDLLGGSDPVRQMEPDGLTIP